MTVESPPPSFDVQKLLERERAIERQQAEIYKKHNITTALVCLAWTAFVCGFLILGPDFWRIRELSAGLFEDQLIAIVLAVAALVGGVWVPLSLFVAWRRRWPKASPRPS